METCTSVSAIQLVAAALGFLVTVLWLDMAWVRSGADHDNIAAALRRRGWLNIFVACGACGAAVLLLVWVGTCQRSLLNRLSAMPTPSGWRAKPRLR